MPMRCTKPTAASLGISSTVTINWSAQIAKSSVRAFEVTSDRRKPRPVEKDPYLDDLHFGTRVGDPIRRQP